MRTVLLANNALGARVGRWLLERGDLVGLVVHPVERRREADALAELSVPTWEWPGGLDEIRDLGPECLLSVLFAYLVPPAWLDVPSWRALNLHPGYLPYNRGSAPNVWPLVDGSPAGTTLHVMTEGLDRGDILCQRQVDVRPSDTAKTLYQRLEDESVAMMLDVWSTVRDLRPFPQSGAGSFHRLADLDALDLDDTDRPTLDKLRARTFPPFGAEFEQDGTRYRVSVNIEPIS
jgi:methionyl-tRNA formyltransferase